MPGSGEEPIGTIDVWELHHYRAPLERIFARHEIDKLELHHYLRDLLATRRWDVIRVVPQDEDGHASDHVYQLYGRSWSTTP